MIDHRVTRPIRRNAEPAQPEQFPPGSRVWLKVLPFGEAGTVVGFSRGRVRVSWRNLRIRTKHRPDALTLAVDAERPYIAHS
jgi:hypothetical protein